MEEVAEAARCLGVHLNLGKGGKMPVTILPPPKQPHRILPSVLQQVTTIADVAQKFSPNVKQIQENAEENENVEASSVIVKQEDTEFKGSEFGGSLLRRPICQSCHKTFKTRRNLRKHMLRKHKGQLVESKDDHVDISNRFKCVFCPKTFANKLSLPRHKRKCHQDLKNRMVSLGPNCPFCKQFIGNRKAIRKHKQTMHPGMVSEGEVSCEYCPRIFRAGFLGHHVKFQHKELTLGGF